MPLSKSKGQMYEWVTHQHSHIAGKCPHACSYCYVQAMAQKFPGMQQRYGGQVRLIEEELRVKYGMGKTIFIEHLNDLFAEAIPAAWIDLILAHCRAWPGNAYVFQTKNPIRVPEFAPLIPPGSMIGTTIESNRHYPEIMGTTARPSGRHHAMQFICRQTFKTFVTVEPILDFDVDELAEWLADIQPAFINIGADSKGIGLPEPPAEKVRELIQRLKAAGLTVKEKRNLGRLLA